jgi:hypothetical protein
MRVQPPASWFPHQGYVLSPSDFRYSTPLPPSWRPSLFNILHSTLSISPEPKFAPANYFRVFLPSNQQTKLTVYSKCTSRVQNITTVLGMVWCHVPWDLINTAALPECRRADMKLNGIFPTLQYSIKLCLQRQANNILPTKSALFICRYSSRMRRSSSRKRDPFTRKNRALVQVQTRQIGSRPSTRHKDRQFYSFLSECILFATNYYSSLLLNTQLLHWRRPHALTLNMDQNTTHAIGINPVPIHAMETYRGSRGIAPLILNLGTR